MKRNVLSLLATTLMLSSCTYSVSMQHSVGSTDTQEESQAASPTISPDINIPITPGSGLGMKK